MTTYQAPKPHYTSKQWVTYLGKRFLFPPILLWDLARIAVNAVVRKELIKLVVPAASGGKSGAINPESYHTDELKCEKHQVITHDGACLDTFEMKYHSPNVPIQEQKYIISFVGNGDYYENNVQLLHEQAQNLKCNVVGFNYRGVSHSTGQIRSKDDLICDGIAQVQRLLDLGVQPKNILLKGHSLGGAIATFVADHFHQHEKRIKLFNDRSFSSITNVVVGMIRTDFRSGFFESTSGKIKGFFAKHFIKLGLVLAKFEMNAAKAYKRIPDRDKEYMVVRSSKKTRNNRGPQVKAAEEMIISGPMTSAMNYRRVLLDDQGITHYGSLHAALKSERRKIKKSIQKSKAHIGRVNNTQVLLSENAYKASASLADVRNKLDARKMKIEKKYQCSNGHILPWSCLVSRYDKSNAVQFFYRFAERSGITNSSSIHASVPVSPSLN